MATDEEIAEVQKEAEAVKQDLAKLKDEYLKIQKNVQDKIAEQDLDEEMAKQKTLLEKQSALLDLQIRETNTELQIAEYKKKAKLPKTTVEERLKIINEVRAEILNKRRELETQNTGSDPEPKFLGKSEDGKENVYEIYNICWNCKSVFKTFKNSIFCSEKCRQEFVSKHQNKRPLVQEEFAERNSELWNWSRIGNYEDETGQHGIFRRVFK